VRDDARQLAGLQDTLSPQAPGIDRRRMSSTPPRGVGLVIRDPMIIAGGERVHGLDL